MDTVQEGRPFRLRDPRHNWVMQLVDFCCVCLGVSLMVWIYPPATPSAALHNSVAAVAGALFCLAGSALQLYQVQWLRRGALDEIRTVCIGWACVVTPLLLIGFATKVSSQFSRVATVTWFLLAPLLIVLCRMLTRFSSRTRRGSPRRVAIAGMSPFAEHIYRELDTSRGRELGIVGVFDDRAEPREGAAEVSLSNAGSFEELVDAARRGRVDVIYIALPLRAERRVSDLIRRLQDTTASVYIAFDFEPLAGGGYQRLSHVGNLPVIPMLSGIQPSVGAQALTLVRSLRRRRSHGVSRISRPPRRMAKGSRLAAWRASRLDQRQGPGTLR